MPIRLLLFVFCVGCSANAINGSGMDGAAEESTPVDSTRAEATTQDALVNRPDTTAVDASRPDRVDASEDVPAIILLPESSTSRSWRSPPSFINALS